jgi:rubrerythrin
LPRTFFDLIAAASLIVFVVFYTLSAVAQRRDHARWHEHNVQVEAHLRLVVEASRRFMAQPVTTDAERQRSKELEAEYSRLSAEHNRLQLSLPAMTFGVRYSRVALGAAVLPCVWAFHRRYLRDRAAKRKAKGQCTHCGYDLRETPDRCPECGTEPGAV